eukprot:363349-Chlamydomonas_euryale.AAC.1
MLPTPPHLAAAWFPATQALLLPCPATSVPARRCALATDAASAAPPRAQDEATCRRAHTSTTAAQRSHTSAAAARSGHTSSAPLHDTQQEVGTVAAGRTWPAEVRGSGASAWARLLSQQAPHEPSPHAPDGRPGRPTGAANPAQRLVDATPLPPPLLPAASRRHGHWNARHSQDGRQLQRQHHHERPHIRSVHHACSRRARRSQPSPVGAPAEGRHCAAPTGSTGTLCSFDVRRSNALTSLEAWMDAGMPEPEAFLRSFSAALRSELRIGSPEGGGDAAPAGARAACGDSGGASSRSSGSGSDAHTQPVPPPPPPPPSSSSLRWSAAGDPWIDALATPPAVATGERSAGAARLAWCVARLSGARAALLRYGRDVWPAYQHAIVALAQASLREFDARSTDADGAAAGAGGAAAAAAGAAAAGAAPEAVALAALTASRALDHAKLRRAMPGSEGRAAARALVRGASAASAACDFEQLAELLGGVIRAGWVVGGGSAAVTAAAREICSRLTERMPTRLQELRDGGGPAPTVGQHRPSSGDGRDVRDGGECVPRETGARGPREMGAHVAGRPVAAAARQTENACGSSLQPTALQKDSAKADGVGGVGADGVGSVGADGMGGAGPEHRNGVRLDGGGGAGSAGTGVAATGPPPSLRWLYHLAWAHANGGQHAHTGPLLAAAAAHAGVLAESLSDEALAAMSGPAAALVRARIAGTPGVSGGGGGSGGGAGPEGAEVALLRALSEEVGRRAGRLRARELCGWAVRLADTVEAADSAAAAATESRRAGGLKEHVRGGGAAVEPPPLPPAWLQPAAGWLDDAAQWLRGGGGPGDGSCTDGGLEASNVVDAVRRLRPLSRALLMEAAGQLLRGGGDGGSPTEGGSSGVKEGMDGGRSDGGHVGRGYVERRHVDGRGVGEHDHGMALHELLSFARRLHALKGADGMDSVVGCGGVDKDVETALAAVARCAAARGRRARGQEAAEAAAVLAALLPPAPGPWEMAVTGAVHTGIHTGFHTCVNSNAGTQELRRAVRTLCAAALSQGGTGGAPLPGHAAARVIEAAAAAATAASAHAVPFAPT